MTGVYMYCGVGLGDDGSVTCNDAAIEAATTPLLQEGLTVGVAFSSVSQAAIQNGAALKGIADLVSCAQRHNLTSLMVDYEPTTNISHVHAEAYAAFVRALTVGMNAVGRRAEMCISSWTILTEFGLYAQTGVNSMMNMASTYYGT